MIQDIIAKRQESYLIHSASSQSGLILKFETDERTDNLCENSDHHQQRLWFTLWINVLNLTPAKLIHLLQNGE